MKVIDEDIVTADTPADMKKATAIRQRPKMAQNYSGSVYFYIFLRFVRYNLLAMFVQVFHQGDQAAGTPCRASSHRVTVLL